jgi:hypothetical protein
MAIRGLEHPEINPIRSATFYVSSTTITLKVNRTQYVGRFSSYADAEEALTNLLTMHDGRGALWTDRLIGINKEIIYIDSSTSTPTAINWTDILADPGAASFSSTQGQVTTATVPVLFTITKANELVDLYVKVSSTTIAANATVSPQVDGYTQVRNNGSIIVQPNYYVRFKCNKDIPDSEASWATLTTGITVQRAGATFDTFNIQFQNTVLG